MLQDEIKELIEPVIEDMGYILWGCEYLPQGKHSLLRIYIDKDVGIGIEDCQKVSKQVSALLDVEDSISANYSLEISSPGMPRPLFYDWQYKQYVGQEVIIKLSKPVLGSRKYTGTILSIENDKLSLSIAEENHEFLISNIVKANLTV
jgi:ribosome maturation factor RimP